MSPVDVEVWREQVEAKRARQHYFWDLSREAARAALRAPRPVKEPKAKKKRKPDRERKVRVVRDVKPCRGCSRPLRPTHTTLQRYPGTVGEFSGGLCASCTTGGQQRFKTPPSCVGCGVELYKVRTPREQRPQGAKRHMGRGLCTTCYGKEAA